MRKLRIVIEADMGGQEVYRAISTISEEAYINDPEILEFAARRLARTFIFDYEMEKSNLQYKPKDIK